LHHFLLPLIEAGNFYSQGNLSRLVLKIVGKFHEFGSTPQM
jgi:hypothetical protein